MKGKILLKKGLYLIVCLLMLSASIVLAQDFCEGDFDYDNDVDGIDAVKFKADFFRKDCPSCTFNCF